MENHAERRKYTRVQLCAYGVDKVCIAIMGQQRCRMDLVDISAGGARLKVQTPLPEPVGTLLSLSVQGVADSGRLQNLSAQIRWRSGQELGIQFGTQLDIALAELQRIVS